MEEVDFLFKSFYKDKRIYNLCEAYWHCLITQSLFGKWRTNDANKGRIIANKLSSGEKLFDANPIFCYQSLKTQKIIRILQIPETEFEYQLMNQPNYLMDAWIDNFEIDGTLYDELVISLFLTKMTSQRCKDIIAEWETKSMEEFSHFIEREFPNA